MFTLIRRSRGLLAVVLLTAFAATAAAQSHSGQSLPTAPSAEREPAGSPEFGLLIILGAVAFLVLVAWLFTRVGDDRRSGGDKSLLG